MPAPSMAATSGRLEPKTLLLLSLLLPRLGGVLLRGPRGVGKSTLVRSLEGFLPGRRLLAVPPGIPEERLFGGLDWEAALHNGCRRFRPGLLARADGHVLFLDGVNRMDPGLLHRILDVSETGILRIEREGLSLVRPVAFSLIAALDPGEGGLSPALLDRFGLCADWSEAPSPAQRRRILADLLEREPSGPPGGPEKPETERSDADREVWRRRFEAAEGRLQRMEVPEEALRAAVSEAIGRECPGHRGEAALGRAAMAWAAWSGEEEVRSPHVREMAAYALHHRGLHPSEPPAPPSRPADVFDTPTPEPGLAPANAGKGQDSSGKRPDQSLGGIHTPSPGPPGTRREEDRPAHAVALPGGGPQDILAGYFGPEMAGGATPRSGTGSKGGRRHGDRALLRQGRSPGNSRMTPGSIDWDATLKRALLFQASRPAGKLRLNVRPEDIRFNPLKGPVGRILLFLVDASGSMGARRRMAAAKGSIQSALRRAYLCRDRVAMMAFRHRECRLLLPPTRSPDRAEHLLRDMATGGGTPLAHGLRQALEFGRTLKLRETTTPLHVLLFTDGRANVSLTGQDPVQEALQISERAAREGIAFTVVDTETGFVRLEMARELARGLGARYCRLDELDTGRPPP